MPRTTSYIDLVPSDEETKLWDDYETLIEAAAQDGDEDAVEFWMRMQAQTEGE